MNADDSEETREFNFATLWKSSAGTINCRRLGLHKHSKTNAMKRSMYRLPKKMDNKRNGRGVWTPCISKNVVDMPRIGRVQYITILLNFNSYNKISRKEV